MRRFSFLLVCCLFIPQAFLQAADAPAAKPNIVYILCDDLGYGDVKCLGGDRCKIATPNIDLLAREGMTFTDAHSSSAVCTPSRYSLLTGRYNWRTRLQNGVFGGYNPPLIAADRLTVPGMLKRQGYTTACVGKWHVGMDINEKDPAGGITNGPTTRGFDYFFGISASADMPPYALIENDRFIEKPTGTKAFYKGRPGPAAPSFAVVDLLPAFVRKSTEWIARNKDRAFFLYLPLASPHTPLAPTREWKGKSGLGDYADFVMETDWALGEVMKSLRDSGIAENTLVIFTSDNGYAPYVGTGAFDDPALTGQGQEAYLQLEAKGHFPSADRRGHKADIFDGGHRIPFIVRWPGKVKAGSTSDQIICLTDLMATGAEITGAKLPDNAGEDSVSILPALLGKADQPLHEAVVHHSINGSFAIRQGKWKLELCADSGGWSDPIPKSKASASLPPVQLYDLSGDVGEKRNVQAEHPEIVERLTKLLEKYIADGRSTPGAAQKNDVPIRLKK